MSWFVTGHCFQQAWTQAWPKLGVQAFIYLGHEVMHYSTSILWSMPDIDSTN